MHELGVESGILQAILDGRKTVDCVLGTPEHIKLRKGHTISFREDVWQDGIIVTSIPGRATATVKQLLYFESFEEMFSAVYYKDALPDAKSLGEALAIYRLFYSEADEFEHGVIAIMFELDR